MPYFHPKKSRLYPKTKIKIYVRAKFEYQYIKYIKHEKSSTRYNSVNNGY